MTTYIGKAEHEQQIIFKTGKWREHYRAAVIDQTGRTVWRAAHVYKHARTAKEEADRKAEQLTKEGEA
jgi:hypothetical protein